MGGGGPIGIDLHQRVTLVTGGTRGIGAGIASAFLGAGADVIVCARNQPHELPAAGERQARFVQADVRDPEDVADLVETVVGDHGRLDVLVNNAGGSPEVAAADASPRFSRAIIDLNLTAALLCATAANRVMAEQEDGGTIVNVASVSGLRPSPGTAAYGAAKAGLIQLTRSLAVEWAPRVRVNAVTPGLVRTDAALDHYGGEQGLTAVAETVPLGRLGTPCDVGHACLFLASDLAAYVTGANLVLDGGGERPAFLDAAERSAP
ncbi:MAG: SDR family oxidoreductase [Actinobacteria bacterium]|nr:SDR family oxidoreductase [Actinomycetota bacterium]